MGGCGGLQVTPSVVENMRRFADIRSDMTPTPDQAQEVLDPLDGMKAVLRNALHKDAVAYLNSRNAVLEAENSMRGMEMALLGRSLMEADAYLEDARRTLAQRQAQVDSLRADLYVAREKRQEWFDRAQRANLRVAEAETNAEKHMRSAEFYEAKASELRERVRPLENDNASRPFQRDNYYTFQAP